MDKKKEFRKRIAIFGATALVAIGSGKMAEAASKGDDLSHYTVRNDQYVDYIDGSEYKKFKKMQELDDSIKKYEELNSKMLLNKEEKEELAEARKSIEEGMASGNLADFYLNDLLKEKLKKAYDAYSVETHYSSRDEIRIDLYGKNGKYETIENKDEITPIKIAMRDIAILQGYIDKDKFLNTDIKEFIRIQKNMKGFSNLKFIKKEGKTLSYAQIELEKSSELEI